MAKKESVDEALEESCESLACEFYNFLMEEKAEGITEEMRVDVVEKVIKYFIAACCVSIEGGMDKKIDFWRGIEASLKKDLPKMIKDIKEKYTLYIGVMMSEKSNSR